MKVKSQSRRSKDTPRPASLKQGIFARFTCCFLTSAVSDEERCKGDGTSSQRTRHSKRQARKKLSSPTVPIQRTDSPAHRDLAKKHCGRRVNMWKRRMDRCPVAASPPSPLSPTPMKQFWKVFTKSSKMGTTAASCPPKASPLTSSVPTHSTSAGAGLPPRPAIPQTQTPALSAAKPAFQPGADSTVEKGGNGGVLVRDSLHGNSVAETVLGSHLATAPCVSIDSPALERIQEVADVTDVQPAQGNESVASPSSQAGTSHGSPDNKSEPAVQPSSSPDSKGDSVVQPSSSPDDHPEPAASAAQPSSSIFMWLILSVALLLGWYWVRALRSAATALPPTQAAAVRDAATVGLRHHLQTTVLTWLGCISGPRVAAVVCCGLLFFSKAGRHLLGAIALGLAAAAVAHYMAAAVGLHFSKLWAEATAVESEVKGPVAALLTSIVVIIVALLAFPALGYFIQAVEYCLKDTDEEAASAPATGPEEDGGRQEEARKSTSSTSSSSSRGTSSSSNRGTSSSSNRSHDSENLAPTFSQPSSRQGWCWGHLFSKLVNVGNSSDESLIKALHTAPADLRGGQQSESQQHEDKGGKGLPKLPPLACGKGCAGLQNPSSNCYANAVIQCLTSFPEWSWQYLSGSAANGLGQPERPVTAAMTALQRTMWASKDPVNPMGLLRVLGAKHSWWKEGVQQDCNSFLLNLLETVQEEMDRVSGPKPYKASLSGEGTAGQQADEAWQYARSRSNSPMQELFTGQLQARTTCGSCKCGHQTLQFHEFQTLSLKFPDKLGSRRMGFTLQELLARFSSTTQAEDYKCGKCGKEGASNQLTVSRWPRILVLQLARFSASESVPVEQRCATIGKVTAPVRIPETLNPSHVTATEKPSLTPIYELQGVVDHEGSLLAGHYTARCRSAVDNNWHHCNDSRVDSTQFDGAPSPRPYLLFYKRKD